MQGHGVWAVCAVGLFESIMSPYDAFAAVLSRAPTHILSTRDALVTEHDILVRRKPRYLTIHKSKHQQVEDRGQARRGPTKTACWVTHHRSIKRHIPKGTKKAKGEGAAPEQR